jgi:hypothetical protein
MPISSVGKASNTGVTLIEMTLVAAIVAMIVGISFPAVSAGLESIRLASASDSLAAFLNGALNRAERRQEAVELTIRIRENKVEMRSADGRIAREMEMPSGVVIRGVEPGPPEADPQPRQYLLLPGGTPPRIAVELANRRGQRRIVRVDPITGAPEIVRVSQ